MVDVDTSYRSMIPDAVADAANHIVSDNLNFSDSISLWCDMSAAWDTLEYECRSHRWDVLADSVVLRTVCINMTAALFFIEREMFSTSYSHIMGADIATLAEKERSYGGSWIRRGGVGAFFMLSRKWDRLKVLVERSDGNLLQALRTDTREEGGMDDIRDLRCYLHLVESQRRVLEARLRVQKRQFTSDSKDEKWRCGCVMGVRRVCVKHCGGHAIPESTPVAP